MSKVIEILQDGAVVQSIISDETFAEEQFPGAWRVASVQPESVAAPLPSTPTRGQLKIALGISDSEIDALFLQASQINL